MAPVDPRVFDALASRSSVPGAVLPRLGSAFASMTVPVVLVLDDVHLLSNRESRAALSVLADHVPEGSRLVLAGRAEPPLRVARLRAEGRILEIGPDDLSFSRAEAGSLLDAAGVRLGRTDVTALDSGCVWGGCLTAVRLDKPARPIKVQCTSAMLRGDGHSERGQPSRRR